MGAALTGLSSRTSVTQGFGRFAAFTLGCSVSRFQRYGLSCSALSALRAVRMRAFSAALLPAKPREQHEIFVQFVAVFSSGLS